MSPVTAESSQPTPQPAQTAQPQPSANNQAVRIAALVVLGLIAVGVVLYLLLHDSGTKKKAHHKKPLTTYIPPTQFNAKDLGQESRIINTKFYWAGKQPGTRYEFRRTTNNHLYVRYLPPGANPKAKGAPYMIIATYPFVGAFRALQKEAGANALPGPNGSSIYVRPKDTRSVLMGFPGVDDQVEIYSPNQVEALATARSGKVKPVRGG